MIEPVPGRVRAFLRRELPRWREEGLIDGAAEATLSRRYALQDDGTGLALAALYVLAAGLAGGGVISLVAWHWDEMGRAARLGLLAAALVAAHGTGHWMWRVSGRRPRLGHALTLLGTAIFGASIGLVAQIFQVSGPWYGAFGAWALGALVAGVALPSLPALCFSAFLALAVWGPGFVGDHARSADLVAWATGGGFLALAFQRRSRVLFLISAAGLGLVLAVAAGELSRTGWQTSTLVSLAAALGVAGAASAFAVLGAAGNVAALAGDAGWLARLALYGIGYVLSYEGVARGLLRFGPLRPWLTCLLPLALVSVGLLVLALRSARGSAAARATAAVAVAFPWLLVLTARAVHRPVGVAALANAALLAVAGIRIAHGLGTRQRGPFWEGLAVAAIVGVSRFFEIESLLWLKGVGFIACGGAVVAAALAFERRLQASRNEVEHG
jgi:uncharacterized membrane protein